MTMSPTIEMTLRHGKRATITPTDIYVGGNGAPMESVGNIAWSCGPDGTGYRVLLYAHGYPDLFDDRRAAMTYAATLFSTP